MGEVVTDGDVSDGDVTDGDVAAEVDGILELMEYSRMKALSS
jgi:hypothetical protein